MCVCGMGVSGGHGGMVLNRMCGDGESKGKPANPGSHGRMTVMCNGVVELCRNRRLQ